MQIQKENYLQILKEVSNVKATLVAVSKTKSIEAITELYDLGQRDFGENYVQELVDKHAQLPADIRWHFIGHLQTNKVKYIASFVHLIHGIDSLKLLNEVNRQAAKNDRVIEVLLQMHIAKEETKFGFDENELEELINTAFGDELHEMKNIRIVGLMGMASFSEDENLVRNEFKTLKRIFDKHTQLQIPNFKLQTLSMGMSGHYKTPVQLGSNMHL